MVSLSDVWQSIAFEAMRKILRGQSAEQRESMSQLPLRSELQSRASTFKIMNHLSLSLKHVVNQINLSLIGERSESVAIFLKMFISPIICMEVLIAENFE